MSRHWTLTSPNRTQDRTRRRAEGPARPFARLPGRAPRPHPEARARPGLAYLCCPARAPPAGPLARSLSGSLSGCGLALPSTLSATSVPGTSPTRGRRPGPALYGRRDCRKLLWPQLSMLGSPPKTGGPSPAGSKGAEQPGENARTTPKFPFRL
jgi:hypothetical protein